MLFVCLLVGQRLVTSDVSWPRIWKHAPDAAGEAYAEIYFTDEAVRLLYAESRITGTHGCVRVRRKRSSHAHNPVLVGPIQSLLQKKPSLLITTPASAVV